MRGLSSSMLKSTKRLGVKIMSRKRKQYSAEFKTKVVLELLQGKQMGGRCLL